MRRPGGRQDTGLAAVVQIVSTSAWLDLTGCSREAVVVAVGSAWTDAGAPNLAPYGALLAHHRKVRDDLVDRRIVGETYFFRNPVEAVSSLPPESEVPLGKGLRSGSLAAGAAALAGGRLP